MSKVVRRSILLLLGSIFLLIGANFSLKQLKQVGFIPIEVVSLTDKVQYADPELIKSVVTEHIEQGFFGLKVAVIRDELKHIPWIADANVQRCWPHTLKIKIFERQPLAIWQDKGIIDTEGKLFFPASVANLVGLPEFIGTQDQIDSMVDMYLKILSALKPIGLAVTRLEIMPDQGWQAMLDNGVTIILGQVELEERLARFVLAYPLVGAGANKLHVIDMRYTNGLSVA